MERMVYKGIHLDTQSREHHKQGRGERQLSPVQPPRFGKYELEKDGGDYCTINNVG